MSLLRAAPALLLICSTARAVEDLPEDLPKKPLWTYSLAQRDARLASMKRFVIAGDGFKFFRDVWRVVSHDRLPAPVVRRDPRVASYPSAQALIDGGRVYYKDYAVTLARRLFSGRHLNLVTDYNCLREAGKNNANPRYLLPVELSRLATNDPSRGSALEGVYRFLDYGGNALIASAGRLVVIEPNVPPLGLLAPSHPGDRASNTLVAYGSKTGKTEWGWDPMLMSASVWKDPAKKRAWEKDHGDHPDPVFLGPGVADGAVLYTLVHARVPVLKPAGVAVWALNLLDGTVLFRTPLHPPDAALQKIPVGATLTVVDGVVYAVSSGTVAAVDGKGETRWTQTYPRSLKKERVEQVRGRRRNEQVDVVIQTFALNQPVVADGTLLVMPPDSKEFLAIGTGVGKVSWRRTHESLPDITHIVGVADGVVVVAGRQVVGLDLATGKSVWGPHVLREGAYGRGFVGKKFAYVPTLGGKHAGDSLIHRFDIKTGKQASPLRFHVARLGNLTYANGCLVVAGEDRISCFASREILIARIDARLKKDGPDPELSLDRAFLVLGENPEAEDRIAARKWFRESAGAEGGIDYAFDNLMALARETENLKPLIDTGKITKAPAHHAQIQLVRALILRDVGRDEMARAALEILARDYGKVEVVLEGTVMSASAAAKKLLR
ncbi:MAG: PQQ-binding-like beta-propeller repeat protein [Planctomycetota bacterium]|nr:PQQ-binding-like beta-propeller repeat protein [Planctomycetota bacterium]